MSYSEKVLDHFEHPRNIGDLPGADAEARLEHPVCGDIMSLAVKLADGRVLVAGGFSPNGAEPAPVDSAAIYDPASATWEPTSDLPLGGVQTLRASGNRRRHAQGSPPPGSFGRRLSACSARRPPRSWRAPPRPSPPRPSQARMSTPACRLICSFTAIKTRKSLTYNRRAFRSK